MDPYYLHMKFRISVQIHSIMMKSKMFMCQNPEFCKKKSTVFDEWIDCIHDCIHDSTIQEMDRYTDTDTNTDGYRYRWIPILSKFLDFQDFFYVMLNACLD